MRCMIELSELQSVLPKKCFPIPGEKVTIILVCIVPLIMLTLRYSEHIRKFVKSSVWKYIDFFNTLYD